MMPPPQPAMQINPAPSRARAASLFLRSALPVKMMTRTPSGNPAEVVAGAAAIVTETGVTPSGVTAFGKVQVFPAESPVQVKRIVPLNPPDGVIERETDELAPATIVADAGPEIVKSPEFAVTTVNWTGADVELL